MDVRSFIAKCCSGGTSYQPSLDVFNENASLTEDNILLTMINCLREQFKFNICEWVPNNKLFPKYLFLGGDRGILAYVVFRYKEGKIFKEQDLTFNLLKIAKLVGYAESELDRPIFFINILNYIDYSGVFFETSDQIRDRIFNDKEAIDKDKTIYKPDILLMGDFDNLKTIWNELKINNVKQF